MSGVFAFCLASLSVCTQTQIPISGLPNSVSLPPTPPSSSGFISFFGYSKENLLLPESPL